LDFIEDLIDMEGLEEDQVQEDTVRIEEDL
jgi:hypothetical protein